MSAPPTPSQASIAARAQALLSRLSQPLDTPPATPEPQTSPPKSIEESVAAEPEPVAIEHPALTTFPVGFATGRVRLTSAFVRSPDYLPTVLALGGHECELYAIGNRTDATIAHATVTAEGYEFEHYDGRVSKVEHGFIVDALASEAPAPTAPTEARGCVCCGTEGCEMCGRLQRVSERLYCHCGSRAPVTEHEPECAVHPSRFPGVPLPRYRTDTRPEWAGEEEYQHKLPDGSFETRTKNVWRHVPFQVRIEEDAYWAESERAMAERARAEKAAEKAKNAPPGSAETAVARPQLSLVPASTPVSTPVSTPPSSTPAASVRPATLSAVPNRAPQPPPCDPLPVEVIVIDTETTGTEKTARIIELAGVRVRLPVTSGGLIDPQGEWTVLGSFAELVDPGIPIGPFASQANGIYAHHVKGKPSIAEVLPRFFAFAFGDSGFDPSTPAAPWIAHNADFDAGRIAYELGRLSVRGIDLVYPRHRVWCTLKMARALWPVDKKKPDPRMPANHKLGTLVSHFALPARPTHRALADVFAAIEVLKRGWQDKPGASLAALCGDGVWL